MDWGRSLLVATLLIASNPMNAATKSCIDVKKAVYLTFDTGHMAVAPLVADVLKRHDVKVTFFAANERTKTDGASLDDQWAPWWRARMGERHEFGSHTWDHWIWLRDTPSGFEVRPTAGPNTGKKLVVSDAEYCEALRKPVNRLNDLAPPEKPGTTALFRALFRAPGGKTSPKLLAVAKNCGFVHVGWSDAGFLGDELPSEKFPNDGLLKKALRDIRGGDIMLAHLGVWSRQDPWAPAVLEPLIVGLKSRGFCFAPVSEHPQIAAALNQISSKAP